MRLWPFRCTNTEPTIAPLSRDHYRFVGHDEALERRSRERREQAEQIRREAFRVDTRDEAPRLRRVR
jgi:hypothetical protein